MMIVVDNKQYSSYLWVSFPRFEFGFKAFASIKDTKTFFMLHAKDLVLASKIEESREQTSLVDTACISRVELLKTKTEAWPTSELRGSG